MNSRKLLYTISIIAVLVFVAFSLTVIMSPSISSSEKTIRIGITDWTIEGESVFYGESYWSDFADFDGDESSEHHESIKIYEVSYLGAIPLDKEAMKWENNDGTSLTRSLTLNDLITHWEGSSAIFKVNHQNNYYRLSFSIPKLENGQYKYNDITEAWNEGELYQKVEIW